MDTYVEPLIISHTSALELHRLMRRAHAPRGSLNPARAAALVESLEKPLHLLEQGRSHGLVAKERVVHGCPWGLPAEELLKVAPGIAVVSPELCLVQLARKAAAPCLVALAMEFCGTYAHDPRDKTTAYGMQPLTDLARIDDSLGRLGGWSGVNRLRKAWPWVGECSASPGETILYELLCLPTRWGGAGLRAPELNHRLPLKDGRKLYEAQSMVPDLYWAESALAVEYDGEEYHSGFNKNVKKAARDNAASDLGLTDFTVTKVQLGDISYIDSLCNAISKKLTGRVLSIRVRDYAEKRSQLHGMLLSM